jgi:hypothetical protein
MRVDGQAMKSIGNWELEVGGDNEQQRVGRERAILEECEKEKLHE